MKLSELEGATFQGPYNRKVIYKLEDVVMVSGTGGDSYWRYIGDEPKAGEVPGESHFWQQAKL